MGDELWEVFVLRGENKEMTGTKMTMKDFCSEFYPYYYDKETLHIPHILTVLGQRENGEVVGITVESESIV